MVRSVSALLEFLLKTEFNFFKNRYNVSGKATDIIIEPINVRLNIQLRYII